MKTSLKLIALFIAAGFPVAALAQSAVASIPTPSAETALTVFVTALFALLFISDYSRRARALSVKQAQVITAPASDFRIRPSAHIERIAA